MAAGDKPRFSISARRRDAPKGSKDRIKVGSAFEGKFPGAYNAKFRELRELVLTDGTVLRPDDYYFDLTDWSEKNATKKEEAELPPETGPDGEPFMPF